MTLIVSRRIFYRSWSILWRQASSQNITLRDCCRLEDIGYGVGVRLLELLVFRERGSKHDIHLLKALLFLQTTLWRYLFGRDAQDLEQGNNVRTFKPSPIPNPHLFELLDLMHDHKRIIP